MAEASNALSVQNLERSMTDWPSLQSVLKNFVPLIADPFPGKFRYCNFFQKIVVYTILIQVDSQSLVLCAKLIYMATKKFYSDENSNFLKLDSPKWLSRDLIFSHNLTSGISLLF